MVYPGSPKKVKMKGVVGWDTDITDWTKGGVVLPPHQDKFTAYTQKIAAKKKAIKEIEEELACLPPPKEGEEEEEEVKEEELKQFTDVEYNAEVRLESWGEFIVEDAQLDRDGMYSKIYYDKLASESAKPFREDPPEEEDEEEDEDAAEGEEGDDGEDELAIEADTTAAQLAEMQAAVEDSAEATEKEGEEDAGPVAADRTLITQIRRESEMDAEEIKKGKKPGWVLEPAMGHPGVPVYVPPPEDWEEEEEEDEEEEEEVDDEEWVETGADRYYIGQEDEEGKPPRVGLVPQRWQPLNNHKLRLVPFTAENADQIEMDPRWYQLQQTDLSLMAELGCLPASVASSYKPYVPPLSKKEQKKKAEEDKKKKAEEEAAAAEEAAPEEPEAPSRVFRYNTEAAKKREAREIAECLLRNAKAAVDDAKETQDAATSALEEFTSMKSSLTEEHDAALIAKRKATEEMQNQDAKVETLKQNKDRVSAPEAKAKVERQIAQCELKSFDIKQLLPEYDAKEEAAAEAVKLYFETESEVLGQLIEEQEKAETMCKEAQDQMKEATDAYLASVTGDSWTTGGLGANNYVGSVELIRQVGRLEAEKQAQKAYDEALRTLRVARGEAAPEEGEPDALMFAVPGEPVPPLTDRPEKDLSTELKALAEAAATVKACQYPVEKYYATTTDAPFRTYKSAQRAAPRLPGESEIPADLAVDNCIRPDLPDLAVRRKWALPDSTAEPKKAVAPQHGGGFSLPGDDQAALEDEVSVDAAEPKEDDPQGENQLEEDDPQGENQLEISWLKKRQTMNDIARDQVFTSQIEWSTKPTETADVRLSELTLNGKSASRHSAAISERLFPTVEKMMAKKDDEEAAAGEDEAPAVDSEEPAAEAEPALPFTITDKFERFNQPLSQRPVSIQPQFAKKNLQTRNTEKEVKTMRATDQKRKGSNPYRAAWYY